ncbi:phospholipase D-like domain-containing protein [Providencia sp. VP23HZSY-1]|uniref:phospholipase D-like domain-containing protein n=1 Tax=Providencia sp. VP23HZSY-1 TaxID=3391806 RepID=UPI003AF6B2B1
MSGNQSGGFPASVQLPIPATEQKIRLPVSTCMVLQMTPSWIPERTKYPMSLFVYAPLINGKQTFAAVAEAIRKAKKSIEIITWGFQPSMYFERSSGIRDGQFPNIAELLEQKAKEGVKVRILVWFDEIAKLGETSLPGWPKQTYFTPRQKVELPSDMMQTIGAKLDYESDKQYTFDKEWLIRAKNNQIKNLSVRTRSMAINSPSSRLSKVAELTKHQFGSDDVEFSLRLAALAVVPTHHQKAVLIDYEDPELAIGFVMGHNMHSQYWDDDKHSITQHKNMSWLGRDGPTAWQDTSNCVYGEVLCDLSDNFVTAWNETEGFFTTDNEGAQLLEQRKSLTRSQYTPTIEFIDALNERYTFLARNPLIPTSGKICRTQPEYDEYDILKSYDHGVKHARNYLYFENQYFRLSSIGRDVRNMVEVRNKCFAEAAATDPKLQGEKLPPFYLFVVTNSTTKAEIGDSNHVGGYQTYKMLETLGRRDLMREHAAFDGTFKNIMVSTQESLLKPIQVVEPDDIQEEEIDGFKSVICTLVSPDSDRWQSVYVHSKLTLVDDTFLIQGSANINLRSMAFDTEIAVVLQDTDIFPIIKPLREHLWGMHKGTGGISDDLTKEFKNWVLISNNNAKIKNSNQKPISPLIPFEDKTIGLENSD